MRKSSKHFTRGNALHRRGNLTEASTAYAHYLQTNPTDKVGYFNLGVTLQTSNQYTAALQCYARALEIDPYYPEALNNTGILLHAEGKLEAARACFARALAARPQYVDAEYNYATAASDADDYEAALLHFSRVLERNPHHAGAWNNLGKVFLALAHPQDALNAFEFASHLNPALDGVMWNLAAARLTLGHLPQGWETFEGNRNRRHAHIPRWDGSPAPGKSVLIHAEQGMGDTIQFSRYCSHVQAGYIVLECHPEVQHLVRGCADLVVPFGTPVSTDLQVPLMDLPHLFETSLDTIPGSFPYLAPDPTLVEQWKSQLKPDHSLQIGLVWAGNPKHKNDRNRSIDPQLLSALSRVPDTAFYCLQQKPESERAAYAHPLQFAGVFDELTFADTAAILMNLDLTISVDTAVAHLAGALGRPVWTLLPHAPDWRWLTNRTDTPWYPTMRLFRQTQRSDWPTVLNQVADELTRLAKSAAGCRI